MKLALSPLVLILALAGCGEDIDPAEQELLDEQATALVEEINASGPLIEQIIPEPILYPDIEQHDMFGVSCSYAPSHAPGTSLGARVIARDTDAFIKLDGEVLRFAADPGSRELPYATRSLYNGQAYSLRLEITGDGEQSGIETMDYEGSITVRDQWDRVVYSASGIAQCGA